MSFGPSWPRTVYGLCSSADETIFYVGSTSRPIRERLAGHRHGALYDHFSTPVQVWIRSVIKAGHELRAVVLMENGCAHCERQEIARRLAAGEPLLNVYVKGLPRHYRAYTLARVPRSVMTNQVRRNLAIAAKREAARAARPTTQPAATQAA